MRLRAFLFPSLRLALTEITVVIGLFVAQVALASDLPSTTSAYEAARHIERTYLPRLQLKGATAETFLKTLLREGFTCSIEAVSPLNIDLPPRVSCDKSANNYGARCPAFRVTATLARSQDLRNQQELYARLGVTRVVSIAVDCMRPYPISPEYLAAREQAELAFRESIDAVARMSRAKDAFDYLLLEGYYCGFAQESNATGAQQPVGLTCYRFRTGIRFCFRGNIVLDAQWPTGLRTFDDYLDSLGAARITGIKVSCEIPAIEAGGKPT